MLPRGVRNAGVAFPESSELISWRKNEEAIDREGTTTQKEHREQTKRGATFAPLFAVSTLAFSPLGDKKIRVERTPSSSADWKNDHGMQGFPDESTLLGHVQLSRVPLLPDVLRDH